MEGGILKRSPLTRSPTSRDRTRAQLKPSFAHRGITSCEIQFAGCWGSRALGFAHAVKRRFLEADAPDGDPKNVRTVALACGPCHRILDEVMTHEGMERAVMEAIGRRE